MCSIEGCGRPAQARTWCKTHWKRWKAHGDPLVTAYNQPKPECSIEDCVRPVNTRGWCSQHYQRWKRHGDPLATTRTPNTGLTNPVCLVHGCGKPRKALGWCAMHYMRWQTSGTLEARGRQWKPPDVCAMPDCGEVVECKGLCNMHYLRLRHHGDPSVSLVSEIIESCWEPGCKRRLAKCGVCWKHYRYYKQMFAADQGGKCAICGIPEEAAVRGRLVLDHDHATGRPRALLCHGCNCGLGNFRESPELMAAAIAFVTLNGTLMPRQDMLPVA